MFSLYINIDHLKLLDKSKSIGKNELYSAIDNCISSWEGIKYDYSSIFYCFPSNYLYSRVNLLKCIQNLFKILVSYSELIGFSLIIDHGVMLEETEYKEKSVKLNVKTDKLNKIWLTDDAYKVLNTIVAGDKKNGLVLLPDSFVNKELPNSDIDRKIVIDSFQQKLKNLKEPINYVSGELTTALYKNIIFWGEGKVFDKLLLFDLRPDGDRILAFINYLVTFNNIFDPVKDLDQEERDVWGNYLTLYNNICIECSDYFVLDDSNVHFNKLIILWFEAFTKRFKTILLINADNVTELDQLWEILSLINNMKIFVIGKKYKGKKNLLSMDELPSLNMCLNESLYSFLKKFNNKSLMILYISSLTKGMILYADILNVFSEMGYNILELKEELDYFKRKGLLLGNANLYPSSDRILYVIKELKGDLVNQWKNEFLKALYAKDIKGSFLYNYIYCLISLNTDYHDKGLKSLFNFVEKELDLGNSVTLNHEITRFKDSDPSLKKIIEYKNMRESRVVKQEISELEISNYNYDEKYQIPLIYIDILNRWSNNISEGLVKSCKDLFFNYQSRGDHFYETRAKIIFSLALLGAGQVSEAVDYLELNTSYSLSINDTLSYIRSGCFLIVSQYIKGNFSGVLRVSDGLLEHSWITLKSKWCIYIMFVRFRALIEICKYEEALNLIEKAIIIAKDCNYRDSLTLLNNWKGRALYYSGNEGKAREVILSNNLNNESYYFMSEIEFYSGNYEKALSFIRKAHIKYDETKLFDENIKWRDGFYLVEEFFDRSNRDSVLKNEIEAFYYMLLIYNGHENDGILGLKKVISKITTDSIGVYDYKYLYYVYESTGNLDITLDFNRDNILNKVFKLLQRRTTNMEAHNQKHLYLNNYLNARISEEARSKKLF